MDKHRRFGRLILALQDAPSHEQRWATGAEGEEQVARSLAKHLNPDVRTLHDRGIPRSRANIDHIVVAASGVWVIDAKRYTGKARVKAPLLGEPRLLIRGRDQTKLVEGLARQVALVQRTLAAISPDVPARGALCFIDTELPRWSTLSINGFPLMDPKRLAKRINAGGPLTEEIIDAIAGALAVAFPPA